MTLLMLRVWENLYRASVFRPTYSLITYSLITYSRQPNYNTATARWRNHRSARTRAAMVSTIGTARGKTQAS